MVRRSIAAVLVAALALTLSACCGDNACIKDPPCKPCEKPACNTCPPPCAAPCAAPVAK